MARRKLTPEDYLARAMEAKTPGQRGRWARRGLAAAEVLDPTSHTMLLRQLYLSHYVRGKFDDAYDVACQAASVGVLADVMHQDAARAKHAAGDIEGAAGHLRLASRLGPASRRAFHWWTLGSLFFLAGRYEDAIGALSRAARWGTTDKPLYEGHLALAKCRAGKKVRSLSTVIQRLEGCPAGQGYGHFVLGQLAYENARWAEARRYLEAFMERTTTGHRAKAIALAGELQLTRETLAQLRAAS